MADLQLIARPHALQAARFVGGVPVGMTLKEIVSEVYSRGHIPVSSRCGAVVMINGEIIPRDSWSYVRPKECAHVLVSIPLHGGGGSGGKNPLATVVTLAAMVVAAYAAPYLAYGLAQAVGAGWTTASGAFIASAGFTSIATPLIAGSIVMAGTALASALFPVRASSVSSSSAATTSQTYSVSGASNSLNKFGAVPVILGKHKHTPPLGAQFYTEISGSDEYLRMLVVWGYGPLKIEDIKIGDTLIGEYDDVEIETVEGRITDSPITLYPSSVLQNDISVSMTHAAGWITRTAPKNADEISIDNVFPSGLADFGNDGSTNSHSVVIQVQYRLVGSDTWLPAFGSTDVYTYTDATVGTVRKNHRWKVSRGNYEVRQCRVTPDDDRTSVLDDITWSALRIFRNEDPINFPYPLAKTAIRIKATDQLSGVISDLSSTVTSYAPIWNGSDWETEGATWNPAALMRLVLTGPANERRRDASQIDDSLGDFYEFCEENDFRFNMVRDSQASVWDTCVDICSAARAAPTKIDGKWGVIIDQADKPVVQHFTPRNSWGFSGEKTFTEFAHAWRISFLDETNDYATDEAFVYADGYDETTATSYETLTLTGLTRYSDVWRQGRYRHAQVRLRPETYKLNADFEHLVCRRGDRVIVGHDVPMWGTAWGRVKSLVIDEGSGYVSGVVLDDHCTMVSGTSYAIRFRTSSGSSLSFSVITEEGETDSLTFTSSVPIGQAPAAGDLAMFGEAETYYADLLVSAVRPSSDLTAEIEFEDYSPAIYTADSGDIPAWNPNVSTAADVTTLKPSTPTITNVQSGTAALVVTGDGGFRSRMLVSVLGGGGSPRTGSLRMRYRPANSSAWASVEVSGAAATLIADPVTEGAAYEYQAQAVSIYGISSDWTNLGTETIVGQSEPPPDPSGYRVNVVGTVAYHSWDSATAIDLSHARIRWTPAGVSEAKWGSSVDVVERISLPATSTTTPVMVGTYLIKFVDYAGNESEIAALATTGIVSVQGMNFVESIEEGPDDWPGSFDGTAYRPDIGGLTLGGASITLTSRDGSSILARDGNSLGVRNAVELLTEGSYDLAGYIDLGDVFTFRITASVMSSGFDTGSALSMTTREGVSIVTRDGSQIIVRNPADVADGSWNVSVYVSVTQDDPAAETAIWSDWGSMTIGDYSARAARCRVMLSSVDSATTPVVEKISFVVDMEDRTISFSADVPETGTTIYFDPAFYVTPEIGLSIADGQEGDNYTMTKTESQMTIAFTNGGTAVSRSISGIARAYGAKST